MEAASTDNVNTDHYQEYKQGLKNLQNYWNNKTPKLVTMKKIQPNKVRQ